MDVADWLKALDLERYAVAFRENDVRAEVLSHRTADDLKELGVAAIGHRRQLLVAIAKLKDENVAPPPTNRADDDRASTSGERRQLTVMFCDLVGSTALSERSTPRAAEPAARVSNRLRRSDRALRRFCRPLRWRWHSDLFRLAHRARGGRRARGAGGAGDRSDGQTGPDHRDVVGSYRHRDRPGRRWRDHGTGDQSKLAIGSTPNLASRLQEWLSPTRSSLQHPPAAWSAMRLN